MQNDPTISPVMLSATPGLYLQADAALAGQKVGNKAPLPSGVTLVAGLYAGTSSGSLSLYAPNAGGVGYVMNGAAVDPGVIPITQVKLTSPFIGGGTAVFAQIKVWQSGYSSYEAQVSALGDVGYLGHSPVFSVVAGNTPYTSTAPQLLAPITVSAVVPEPTVAAIAGLGLASMLIFRRKK